MPIYHVTETSVVTASVTVEASSYDDAIEMVQQGLVELGIAHVDTAYSVEED